MAVLKDLIVHGRSQFINGASFNTINAESIGANEGIFNKLVATTLDAKEATIENLTATNAKVVGLLDVQGEMHTKTWTNSNISNIGGSFYISPTVSTTIAAANTPMSITIGGSANARTFQVSGGGFVTDAVKIYSDGSTSTASWAVGSHVMVTGNIRVGTTGVDYPLGTLTGYLTAALASGGFTVGEINSTALETIIGEVGTSNLKSYDIKISMFEIGPKTALKPVGIMMTSYGIDKSTYLDIYGGVNQKNSSGVTSPNLRIGYLGGLNSYTDSAGNTRTPVGWGIYTDNGFFKGVVVANSGSIGLFTINSKAIYSGSHDTWNKSSTGIFLGTNDSNYYISGGSGASWWIRDDGRFQFGGANGITYNGTTLSIPAANVSGTLTAATMQTYALTALQANLTNANVNYLSAITANMGTLTAGTISYGTTGNNDSFYLSANSSKTANIAGASRNGLRLTVGSGFGVDKNGILYATGANISGTITITDSDNSNVYTIDEINTNVSAIRDDLYGVVTYEYVSGGTTYVAYPDTEDLNIDGSIKRYYYTYYTGSGDNVEEHIAYVTANQLVQENGVPKEIIKGTIAERVNSLTNETSDLAAKYEELSNKEDLSLISKGYASINNDILTLFKQDNNGKVVSALELTSIGIDLRAEGALVATMRNNNGIGIMRATNMEQTYVKMIQSDGTELFQWVAQSNGHLSLKKL